ncbi:Protein CASP, partial [Cucurbita argyrosperma subsp. sororia]
MESPQGGSERDKPPDSSSSTSPVSVVSSFWKEFDLEEEKSALDEQGLRIAENQENSQKNRRKLAESTREEVDNLTKRAKFGENSFLNIYQQLYEAPDPYPALASIGEQDLKLSELESKNKKMKVELEEFRTEATHLKNQQATIRKLGRAQSAIGATGLDTIPLLDSLSLVEVPWFMSLILLVSLERMEEKIKEIVDIKQRSLAEENQKALDAIKERERLLQDQLRREQESVSNMKRLHERAQSQLFELRAQSEKSNSLVNMELHEIETTLSSEREQHIIEIKNLNALINEKEAAIDEMKRELQARPTEKMVDDLRKNEVPLHFDSLSPQGLAHYAVPVGLILLMAIFLAVIIQLRLKIGRLPPVGKEMSKMESLLLDKNRKMEHELTQYKVKLSEKTSLLDTAESKRAELTEKVAEQQKLIQKLEEDILKGYNSKDQKGSLFDDWDLSEARSELSEEIRQLKEKVGQLTVELEKTKADNVKLYGKIRYVQYYNHEKVVSRGSKKHGEDLESGSMSDVESKYKKIYEDDTRKVFALETGKGSEVQRVGFQRQDHTQQWTISSGEQV